MRALEAMRGLPVWQELDRLLDAHVARDEQLLLRLAITKLVYEYHDAMARPSEQPTGSEDIAQLGSSKISDKV